MDSQNISQTTPRAMALIQAGLVKVDVETNGFVYFTVKSYDVYYDKARDRWSCTCEFSSMWRFGRDLKTCSHIRSCMLKINIQP